VNIGKWVLRNLFIGFIREEQRARRKHSTSSHEHPKLPANLQPESNGNMSHHRPSTDSTAPAQTVKLYTASLVISSPKMIPAVAPSPTSSTAPATRSSPLLTPRIPIHPISKDTLPLPPIPQSPLGSNHVTPVPRHTRTQTVDGGVPPLAASKDDYFTMRVRPSSGTAASDDPVPQTPGAGLMGRLKSFGGKVGARKGSTEIVPPSPSVGRTSIPEAKAEVSSLSHSFEDRVLIVSLSQNRTKPSPEKPKTHQQVLLSGTLSPPSSSEAPNLNLPSNMTLLLSEEDYLGWKTIYRGTVANTSMDLSVLEDVMPGWLLEYLLTNKIPSVPVSKVSFVLLPWPHDEEPLPELLNT